VHGCTQSELNAVLLGPGEGSGIAAGVPTNGVGAGRFGYRKPPVNVSVGQR
jgi:hypothetical protein